jgi:hypothetical protein
MVSAAERVAFDGGVKPAVMVVCLSDDSVFGAARPVPVPSMSLETTRPLGSFANRESCSVRARLEVKVALTARLGER